MTGQQVPENDEHARELRVALDPDTSLDQLRELERSEHEDVRLAVGANYSGRMARYLLAQHLANGARAQVEMTNLYQCWDGIVLRIPIGDGADRWTWEIELFDPDWGGGHLDSTLFTGIVKGAAPDRTPSWSEFRFTNPRPDWDDIHNDLTDEGFDQILDNPPSWPEPMNGHDFHVWALALLQSEVHVPNGGGARFLREQEALILVGSVDINLVPEPSQHSPHLGNDDIQRMIRFLRTDTIRSSSDPYLSSIGQWARLILEPLIVANPRTATDTLMVIAEDPTCPAMNIMRIAPWLPEDLRAFAALGSPDALYGTLWEPAPRSAPNVDRHEMPPDPLDDESPAKPDALLFATFNSRAGDKSPASDLTRLLNQIDDLVPDWMNALEYEEGSVGFLLQRHNRLLQSCFWLRNNPGYDAGDIGISAGLAEKWISSLSLLVEALEEGADYSRIEALAFESWLSEDEIQALHRGTEVKSLIEKAQDDFLARDYEGSRAAARAAVELGSNEALYLSAIIESLLGEHEAREATLVKAAEAGIVHATGELGSLECARGEYSAAIERLTGIPLSHRNASVWVALSWALLVVDRSDEYLDERGVEWDDDRLKSVLDEPSLFEKFWPWHEHHQIGFVANHLACAVLNRDLTAYELAVLDALLERSDGVSVSERSDGVSELILIAAYTAQSEGSLERRDQLLGRLTAEETQQLGDLMRSALGYAPPKSNTETYFSSLGSLITLADELRGDP